MKKILSLQNNGKERKSWSIICENFPIYAPKKIQFREFLYKFKTLLDVFITAVKIFHQLNDWWKFCSNINFKIFLI